MSPKRSGSSFIKCCATYFLSRAYLVVVPSDVHPSVIASPRPLVVFFFFFFFFFFETCLRCSPSGLVVSTRIWFRSVAKYGHAIFTVIASPLKPLEEFRRNLAYAFLSKSRYVLHMNSFQCLDVSARKWFRSINKYGWTAPTFKIAICTLLNTVTISLSHLLQDHWSVYFETCLSCSLGGLVVSAQKWFRSGDKCGRRQPSLIFSVIVSPSKPLEEFSGNLAYEFLSMSRCVCRKKILLRQQIWPNCGNL